MVTWRKLITESLELCGESWADVVSVAPLDVELDVEFDDDFGGPEGRPFTVWTSSRVYFPAQYDGAEWVASVSRHPDGVPTNHVGGSTR